jgi:Flp pilus assembly protein TadD
MPQWAAAIPSLATILAVLLLGAAGLAQRPSQLEARYHRDADAAIASGDFRTARVCYERLLQRSPTDPALLFGLAQSLEGLDQKAQAAQILNRLAPVEGGGYPPAHVFLAQQVLDASTDDKSLKLAEAHLRHALQIDPANADARDLLMRIYENTGRSSQSIP